MINHSRGEWVRDKTVHTNSSEGVWALFKRQIYGIHHWVSDKHLSRHLSGATWRFNRCTMDEGDRVSALLECVSGRLIYQALIA